MRTLNQIQRELYKFDRKKYYLLFGSSFFSMLLITAYVTMMRSPTVLTVLPEGGDSRKQVMAIFLLTALGCCVFIAYAAALFFKYKSRETGIMMALGASKKILKKQLYRTLLTIGLGSCMLGALLGEPLAYGIWQFFRYTMVDSSEMIFRFSAQAYVFSAGFTAFVLIILLCMGRRFVNQSNIMDVVNSQRKYETVRDVKSWYGWGGLLLMLIGGVGGYYIPGFIIRQFQWYPPGFVDAMLYIPLIIGLYLVLLYTVVHGWTQWKNRYHDLIPRSMMKFQGKQTINNMLVITVLVAGAYFASFYAPMLLTGSFISLEERPIDYQFHYRQDETAMINKSEIEELAKKHHVDITSYMQQESANLVRDGEREVDDPNGKYHYEYEEESGEGNYISEYAFEQITGEKIEVLGGTCRPVLSSDKTGGYMVPTDASFLTNPVTGERMDVVCGEELYNTMLFQYYVLNDADYEKITQGLTSEWKERIVDFNVKDVKKSYSFSKALYNEIIERSSVASEVASHYDRIVKRNAEANGETYYGDMEEYKISYKDKDTSSFRLFWKYAPMFRVMELQDMYRTMSVYLMLFIFIALICFAAVFVIAYTRCITVAMYNRQMYADLKYLGAGRTYLYNCAKSQILKVFKMPVLIGTSLTFALYFFIMFGNDGGLTAGELAGIRSCVLVIIAITLVIWGFYRSVLRKVCKMLEI
ncbi:MAG: ABC transporter permease [Hespellia sp.]|nr:ABC transporter permease [Hespellia sp.]